MLDTVAAEISVLQESVAQTIQQEPVTQTLQQDAVAHTPIVSPQALNSINPVTPQQRVPSNNYSPTNPSPQQRVPSPYNQENYSSPYHPQLPSLATVLQQSRPNSMPSSPSVQEILHYNSPKANKHRKKNKRSKQKSQTETDVVYTSSESSSDESESSVSSDESSVASHSHKRKRRTASKKPKPIKLGGKLLNLDKADNFVPPSVMTSLRKHRYVKLYTFTDIGLSRVKTIYLVPKMNKTMEIVLAKGGKQLVASAHDPSEKNWPDDCDLSIDQIRQACPRFLRAISEALFVPFLVVLLFEVQEVIKGVMGGGIHGEM